MSKLSREQFIDKLAPYAIADMHISKVPASLTIAQGILESADGNSELSIRANNLFGIKGTGTAGTIALSTIEYYNGKRTEVIAKFRMYHNWGESVADHSKLITNGVSWNRQLYQGVIGKDGEEAAREIAKAGYATDPNYANKLIAIMHQHNLFKFDKNQEVKPMQPNIDKRITDLEETVKKIIIGLTQVSDKLAEIPAPDWFIEEFPDSLDLISNDTGTYDFWRSFAVALRLIRQTK